MIYEITYFWAKIVVLLKKSKDLTFTTSYHPISIQITKFSLPF